jgi:type IV pilus assembly protein PilC
VPGARSPRFPLLCGAKRRKFSTEKFLIFNQQFMTLFRAGLPIRQSLSICWPSAWPIKKLGRLDFKAVRDEVKQRRAALGSVPNARASSPPIYVTSVMAGEKSGALADVIERYVTYQKLSLAVRKKMITVSLIYPDAVDWSWWSCLIVFLITYRGAEFRRRCTDSMSAKRCRRPRAF